MTLQEKIQLFDPNLELSHAKSIPSLWYRDEEIHSLERQSLFKKGWQYAGRAGDLSEAGSFLTLDLAGESIVLTRDRMGEIRALSNVCRHKATQVMTAPCGKVPALQCRYHGWTYDLTGKLKGAPEMDGVSDFNKEDYALPSFRVEVVGPMLFVNLDRAGEGFGFQFPEFSKELQMSPAWGELMFFERREYTIECNWKVFVDNYLDGGYHVNTLHPALAGAIDYAQYKTDVFKYSSLQSTPLKPGTSVSNVRKGVAQYWWLMPNLMVNLYEGVMDINWVQPISPTRCKVIFDFYFTESLISTNLEFVRQSIEVAHQVQLEDQEVSESVQRGLISDYYHQGRFSVRRENAAYAFHQLLHRSLLQNLLRPPLGNRV